MKYSDGWEKFKTNNLDELELYYLDFSAVEKYCDEVWTAMKYMGMPDETFYYASEDEYLDYFYEVAEMLGIDNVDNGIYTPTRVAPRDPGRYVAMLIPASSKKMMSFSDESDTFPIYAASLFTIKSTDDSCKHEWEYSGLSGTAGPFLADYVKKLMHERMNGTINEPFFPPMSERTREILSYVGEFLEDLVTATLEHAQDEDFDETFTYDSYEDLTAPLNDLFSKITAKCSDCGKKQYIEVKGASEDAPIKGVQIDDSHWTATGLKDEYVTYYVSVDKLVEAISPFFREPFESTTDDFMYEVAKEVYKALSGVLGSARTTAPVKAGKYVAFTTFKGEYGEPLDLSKLSDTILNGMSMIWDDDPTDTDPVTMRKYYKAMKTVDSALEDLLDVAVTFYAVRPETVLEPGKTYEKHIKPAVDYVNSKVKNTLSKYDAPYVENAREKINEVNDLAKRMKLTEDEKAALQAANNKVLTAEKKLKVMNSRTSITKLTAGKRKVKVAWNALGNDVSGYKLYRSTKKYGTYKAVKVTTATAKTNTGLKKGKKYYYKVRGYAKIGGQLVYTNYSTAKAKKAK